jgi:hypothetical protein
MPFAGIIKYVQERWACRELDRQARKDYPQHAQGGGGDDNPPHGQNTRAELDAGRNV